MAEPQTNIAATPDEGNAAPNPEIAALVERAQRSDALAFAALYERFKTPIYTYLVRLCYGDKEAAADLSQDVFLNAWRSLPRTDERLRQQRIFAGWLYRIASNAAASHQRKKHARTGASLDTTVAEDSAADAGPDDIGTGREVALVYDMADPDLGGTKTPSAERLAEIELVKLALARLPQEQAMCLVLHIQAGFDLAEIAQITDTPLNTVKTRLRRGRLAFRTHYEALEKGPQKEARR